MTEQLNPCAEASEWLRLGMGVLNVVQVVLLAWIANHAIKKNELDHRRWQMNFNEQAKVRSELKGCPLDQSNERDL